MCEGAVTYRGLGGGGLLRGAGVGGAGLSTGCNCSLQDRLTEKFIPGTKFSIQSKYLTLSEHLVPSSSSPIPENTI